MADRYWVGGSGNWSDITHWSITSGGLGGASVPADGDSVYIDTNSNILGDFTININVETANLSQIYITYPASKGIVTINQYKRVWCKWNADNGIYHQGGLISGNSTSDYSKVRWTKKSWTAPDYDLHLTRFVLWGNMTSSDDGFALVTNGSTDCFNFHIYGTDCQRNSRVWIYRMNTYIHTPATVTNPNNSNTVYGCDISFSKTVLGTVNLHVYSGAKLACDWQDRGYYPPSKFGVYLSGGGLTIENGGSIDVGITIEGTISTLNLPSGFVFPRFLKFQGQTSAGWTWVGGDIEVADNLPVGKGYVAFGGTYTANSTGVVNMNGKKIRAPKLVVGVYDTGINDVTPLPTTSLGSKVYNVGDIDTKELYIGATSVSSAEDSLILASGSSIKNTYTGAGANITIYTGNGKGGILDMSASGTVLESNIMDLSHNAYANNITFKSPTSNWKCYGNITFGGKVSYTYNGCNINIKNNLTINNSANTNARQWGNLAVDSGKVLTVNGVVETVNGAFEDGQVAVSTNSRLISKNHGGIAKYNRVYGKATWSSPAYYTFATVQDLSEGIVLDIRNPSSGATEFGFDVDNVGVKKVQVQAGASWGVYSGCNVYANELDDRGTLLTALPYGGKLWLNIMPVLPFRPIDPEYVDGEFDICPTPVDFARGVD